MLSHSYDAVKDIHLPLPEFTPGITPLGNARATSNFPLVGTERGHIKALLLPSKPMSLDSAAQQDNNRQLVLFIVDQRPRIVQKNISDNLTFIPFSEHASLVSSALGLGKSDIARILSISRPTLYSWIKGTSEPRESDHPERLRTLGELAREICMESRRPLYHRFVEEPLPNQTTSIFNLLLAEQWDSTQLRQLLAEARRLTSERDQRLGHDIPINVNQAKKETNLLDNSIALNLG